MDTDDMTSREPALDAAIAAGEKALPQADTLETAVELAQAYQQRWDLDRADFADAERAIELWRLVLAQVPGEPVVAFWCGALLAHRTERTGSPADAAEAVRLAGLAARAMDDADCWYLLGWAHLVREYSARQPGGVAAALPCFETALRHDPDVDLRARITREHLRGVSTLRDRGELTREQFRVAVERGTAVLASSGRADLQSRALLAGTLAMLEVGAATQEGRVHDVARIRALITPFDGVRLVDPHLRAELDAARSQLDLFQAEDVDLGVRTVNRLAASTRFDEQRRAEIAGHRDLMITDRAAQQGDLRAATTTRVPPGVVPAGPAAAAQRMDSLQTRIDATDDVATLRRLAGAATELLPAVPDTYRMLRIQACATAGTAELAVARRDRADRAAAERAAGHFAQACALARGPHHAHWPKLALRHGISLRLLDHPDRAESRRLGQSALLALTWQALVQADTPLALTAVQPAAETVRTVADWCVQDGADDELVAVLDTGRGLALHAAAASRSMPERLSAAGRGDLAERWRATGGDDPADNLRVQALHALTAGSELLTPVTVEEIKGALHTVRADALVYLVAGDDSRPGMAVVVPSAGRVRVLRLPELTAAPAPDGRAAGARDLAPAEGSAGNSLAAVGRWAWSAGLEPLLEHLGPERNRLVLVPTGTLSLVPWHAARFLDLTGRHHALERLVISYGVSARMFCATAGHPLRPARSALIVGDPRGDLPHAATEARALHRTFYPGGTRLGRATRDDVLKWIATPGRGPSLLHLACHGHIDPDQPADAHLSLADGELPARELLQASRTAGLDLDLVVLSACSTSAAGAQHDEAVSLATSFLAGGAHTVIGSLWRVPDEDTARLMFLLHHHLSAGAEPVDALRRAQLWMLDPARTPPPGMPPGLAAPQGTSEQSWAAFVHLGR